MCTYYIMCIYITCKTLCSILKLTSHSCTVFAATMRVRVLLFLAGGGLALHSPYGVRTRGRKSLLLHSHELAFKIPTITKLIMIYPSFALYLQKF